MRKSNEERYSQGEDRDDDNQNQNRSGIDSVAPQGDSDRANALRGEGDNKGRQDSRSTGENPEANRGRNRNFEQEKNPANQQGTADGQPAPRSGTSKRGFASMNPEDVREIASRGGKAAHLSGNAHEFTSAEARKAARERWG